MNDAYPPSASSNSGRINPEISLGVSPPSSTDTIDDLAIWLRDHGVEEVECVTPDFAGIGRGKVMPAAKFTRIAPTYLPTSLFFLTITGEYPDFEGFSSYDTDADLALRPDLRVVEKQVLVCRGRMKLHDVIPVEGQLVELIAVEVERPVIERLEPAAQR